jgi:hypothetical protein
VMDDVHRLEDRARADLAVSLAGGEQQELDDARPLDGAGDGEVEIAAEVLDRFVLDALEAGLIDRIFGPELLRVEKTSCFGFVAKVETVPVDDGVAAQDQADGLEIREAELFDALEPIVLTHSDLSGGREGRDVAEGRTRGRGEPPPANAFQGVRGIAVDAIAEAPTRSAEKRAPTCLTLCARPRWAEGAAWPKPQRGWRADRSRGCRRKYRA